MSTEAKRQLRRSAEQVRAALGPEDRARRGEAVRAFARFLPPLRSAQLVALYAATGSEVPTAGLFADLRAAGKRVAFPRLEGDDIELREVGAWSDLAPGRLGVLEPSPSCPHVAPADVDVWLVPGVAFSRGGERLGRGGGHYDRLLARARPGAARVGVCFAPQVVDRLPTEAHDVVMQWLLTDAGIVGPFVGRPASEVPR